MGGIEMKKASFYMGPSEIHGEAIVSLKPLSFLGGINNATGVITDEKNDICGQSIAGKILVYPFGKGSTGDTLRMLRMILNGVGPTAIINHTPDPIHVEGALISGIGILFGLDDNPCDFIKSGDKLRIVDGVIFIEK